MELNALVAVFFDLTMKVVIVTRILHKLASVSGAHELNRMFRKNACYPAGHYYSTIVSLNEIKKREETIWQDEVIDGITGIDLNTANQLALLKDLYPYYSNIPFQEKKTETTRYYFDNEFYSYTDAIILHSLIRHYKPRQIIEIGSGFSSSVMLDTNDLFFNNQIRLTFIEPYPSRLHSLMKKGDSSSATVIQSNVQSVSVKLFEKLNAGDILFIDSSHVVKTGSDVHYILFEILPRLKAGILIHFHDVFYPFEYPRHWVFKGKNWNEDYFLRAFLMYNNEYEIKLFSDYLHKHHKTAFESMPLCYKNSGGNLWLEKQ